MNPSPTIQAVSNVGDRGGVSYPWASVQVLVPLLGGICIFAGFMIWEAKGARLPIIPGESVSNDEDSVDIGEGYMMRADWPSMTPTPRLLLHYGPNCAL